MSEGVMNYEGYCHGDDPRWNHSFYFDFYDIKSKISGFIRVGIMENLREANNWFLFCIKDKPLYVRTNMNLPYTSKNRMDKGIEVAGIRLTSLEPLKKARIEYSDPEFTLDLLVVGQQPMVDCMEMSFDEDDPFRKLNDVHMEGTCRYTGSITLRGGKRFEIDGLGFRDIGVGARNWDSLLYYGMTWPVFSNGVAFSSIHGISRTGQHGYMKMLYDGKQWVRIKRFEDWNEFEEDGISIKSLHWKYWDANGGMWEYTGKSLGFSWAYPCDNFIQIEQMIECRLSDGTVGYSMAEQGFLLDSLRPGPEFEMRRANTLTLPPSKGS